MKHPTFPDSQAWPRSLVVDRPPAGVDDGLRKRAVGTDSHALEPPTSRFERLLAEGRIVPGSSSSSAVPHHGAGRTIANASSDPELDHELPALRTRPAQRRPFVSWGAHLLGSREPERPNGSVRPIPVQEAYDGPYPLSLDTYCVTVRGTAKTDVAHQWHSRVAGFGLPYDSLRSWSRKPTAVQLVRHVVAAVAECREQRRTSDSRSNYLPPMPVIELDRGILHQKVASLLVEQGVQVIYGAGAPRMRR